ncbi:MAG: glycosyl transferase [Methanobrevibacter woesei]|nr:glycosyl transferase [Methanobrevibacter woesei]MCI7292072.1 glycosyl transferase [Methanobrevibacter woesei]
MVEVASEIEKLVLSGKADMVIGNRLAGKYFEENKRRFHNTGNKLVRKAINILFKCNLGDIMTGMRGFSYRFVKSYPVSSQEFEIETEMTIFALNNNFLIEEVNVEYRDRIEGSESKLNTYRDGFKVLSLILSLFRDTRPLFFFSLATLVLLLIAAIYFLPIFINYLDTGYVEKIPTLIMASTVVIIAVVIFFSGVVLHVLKKQHQQRFEQFLNMIEMKKRELENHR